MKQTTAVDRSASLAQDLLLVTGGAALTAVAAQVSIPLQPVPITLQTLSVTVCGLALGARRGAASQVAYLAAGAAGLPVFAEFKAGPQWLFGVTGGYLIAFVLCAWVLGTLSDRGFTKKALPAIGALLLGNALILAVGSAWLSLYVGAAEAWRTGVVPFLTGAVIKSVLALPARKKLEL